MECMTPTAAAETQDAVEVEPLTYLEQYHPAWVAEVLGLVERAGAVEYDPSS